MQALNIIYVLIAIAMVALILVQKGAGATAGAAFGSGASGTVFGARGAGNFLTRTTWILATLFCVISLVMAVMVSRMTNSPETDLGVVSSTPAAAENLDVADPGLAIPEDTDLSLPSAMDSAMDSTEQQIDSAVSAASEAVEDLPSIDETGSAPTEDEQSDPASGSESDGS